MNNQEKYFMMVAETLNISLVAKRAYISHQCVSSYIRQLEERLNVRLFNRSPSLSLTREGEILFHGLQEIKRSEDNLYSILTDTNRNCKGHLKIGFPRSRVKLLVTKLIPPFKKNYRNVDISITSDFSNVLEALTQNGSLDLYIGTGKLKAKELNEELLLTEKLFYVISDSLLKEHFGRNVSKEELSEMEHGICLSNFLDVPLIITPPPSRLRSLVDKVAEQAGTKQKIVFEINEPSVFQELCRENLGAAVISHMFLAHETLATGNDAIKRTVIMDGKRCDISLISKNLYCFPINNLESYHGAITISYSNSKYIPTYMKDFISMTKDIFKNMEAMSDSIKTEL